MKTSTKYFFAAVAAWMIPSPCLAVDRQTGSGETDGYHLVWQDLFDGDELDPLSWDIEVNGNGGGNQELQYYTDRPENVTLGDDGEGNKCLIITAKREYYKGKGVTSGRLTTKGRVAFTHGKVEAAIKFPKTADGLWPAFWMMGNDIDDVGWPRCGETDIIEMGNQTGIVNHCQERYFNGASHWGPAWPQISSAKSLNASYSLQDGEFHLFTLIWDENGYKMYYDLDRNPQARPYYSMTCPVKDPANEKDPGNYFHKPNFILFNLAVGGTFPNIYNLKDITALNEENGYKASMYVNYLKIYQKGLPGEYLDFINQPSGLQEIAEESGEGSIRLGESAIEGDGDLTLYSLDGMVIAFSSEGRIATDSLEPGIYIARSGKNSMKIAMQ